MDESPLVVELLPHVDYKLIVEGAQCSAGKRIVDQKMANAGRLSLLEDMFDGVSRKIRRNNVSRVYRAPLFVSSAESYNGDNR